MDESRRVQIEERIAVARRMVAFAVPQDLANDAEWLMAELRLRTESYNQCSAELRASHAKCDRLKQERDESKAEALAERDSANDWANRVQRTRNALGLKAGENVIDSALAIREERDSLRTKLDASERSAIVERKDHADGIAAIRSQLESQTKHAIDLQSKLDAITNEQESREKAIRDGKLAERLLRISFDAQVQDPAVMRMIGNWESYHEQLKESGIIGTMAILSELAQAPTSLPSSEEMSRVWYDCSGGIEESFVDLRNIILAHVAPLFAAKDATIESQAKRIAELESLFASALSTLPTEDDIRKAWYSGDMAGIGAGVGVVRMLQDRFVPLLAAKDAETERLRLALETKTRDWMVVATNCDNLKEQQRRLMGDLAVMESRAIKAERAVKLQLPSVSEMHEWFLDGYGDARSEVSSTQDAAEANGIQQLRNRPAGMFGEDSAVVTNDAPKTTTELAPAPGLRQRFIDATKKDDYEANSHRPVYFHDILRLCDVIDSAPCSSAEALTRVCADFSGTTFKIDPSMCTLQQQEWSTIGRELKKRLGYEPTVYSDRIELRDGSVWFDYESQKLTFTMN